jgi:8-oxo-dGTP pyrophosphatase MutT (NUDIX family)
MKAKYNDLHRVVGTVIIHRDSKFLVTKRSEKLNVLPGLWTVPGGGFEVTDYVDTKPTHKNNQWYRALELGIKREVYEETRLEVGDLTYLTNIAFIRPDGKPCLILSFFAPYLGGDVVLSDEDTEYRWIGVDELDTIELIDGIGEEIKMVDEILKQRK